MSDTTALPLFNVMVSVVACVHAASAEEATEVLAQAVRGHGFDPYPGIGEESAAFEAESGTDATDLPATCRPDHRAISRGQR